MSETTHADLQRLIEALGPEPHPEGGYFRETYRSPARTGSGTAPRSASTAIYFLLPGDEISVFHRLRGGDEIWHHHTGDPVEIHTIGPEGEHRVAILGPDVQRGERPQVLVPAGTLQAAAVRGRRFALCGCTVTPGFEFSDFEIPPRDTLLADHPGLEPIIRRFTRA